MFYLGKIIFSILRGKLQGQLGLSSTQGKYLIRKRLEPLTTHSFILILIIVWKHEAIRILLILIHYISSKIGHWELSLAPPRHTRLAPLYSNLKLLQFPKIFMYSVQLLVYKRHQGILPSIFQYFFCTNFDVSGRNTRQSDLLHMPEGKLSVRGRTVSFSGVSLHNYFVNLISYNSSLVTYKRMLKNVLITSNNEPDIPKWWRNHFPDLRELHCAPSITN